MLSIKAYHLGVHMECGTLFGVQISSTKAHNYHFDLLLT